MRTLIRSTLFALLACAVAAQDPPPPLPAEHFQGRREALLERLAEAAGPGEKHVVLLRGAPARADMAVFYQDHDVYYLTGVVEPDIAVLLQLEGRQSELLVPPFSPFTAKWDGARLAPGETAARLTGFATVGNVRSSMRRLEELLGEAGEGVVLWTLLEPQPNQTATPSTAGGAAQRMRQDALDGRITREQAAHDKLLECFPKVEIRDLTEIVGRLRAVKTKAELAAIGAAADIAAQGIIAAMQASAPGVYEFQLAAAARHVFSRLGAGPDAYAAIVGSGANGCVLHYQANAKRTAAGELVVMDYAPTVRGYCADVTRTFPVDGKFTPEQRKLVQDVYEIQQALIARVKPGERLADLGRLCEGMLRERGYRSDHGPCHHVGLAVHDKMGDVLEPGMVITVEPGAYLHDAGMGCRIEDTLVVTETGSEVLSGRVPAAPDAIERLMQDAGRLQGAGR